MQAAIHPHHEQEPYHLPHQGMWFVLLLIILLLLAGKNVATSTIADGRSAMDDQCVIA